MIPAFMTEPQCVYAVMHLLCVKSESNLCIELVENPPLGIIDQIVFIPPSTITRLPHLTQVTKLDGTTVGHVIATLTEFDGRMAT